MALSPKLVIALLLLLVVFLTGTIGYKIIGGDQYSLLDAVYMTAITISTVGYQEVIDLSHNLPGRVFTILLILCGLGILIFVSSTLAAFIIEGELTGFIRRRKMNQEIAKLTDHYIVCGAGATGLHVIQELYKSRRSFVAIDLDEERLGKLAVLKPCYYLKGDATDDEVLLQAGIKRAAGLAAALPSDKDNLFVIVSARQLNPGLRIVSQGIEDQAINKLEKAGANRVVSSRQISGLRIASELIRPTAVKFLDLMLRDTPQTTRIEELCVDINSPWANQTLSQTQLREKYNLLVLAIEEPVTHKIIYNPPSSTPRKKGSTLVVMGEVNQVQQASALCRTG